MNDNIRIAVDAMGGDGAPKKIIDGIVNHNKKSKNVKYLIFGDQSIIKNHIPKSSNIYSIAFICYNHLAVTLNFNPGTLPM